jgi:hypothetical protein
MNLSPSWTKLRDKVVFTVAKTGKPFHLLNHVSLSVNKDRRIIVWLLPEKLNGDWKPFHYDEPAVTDPQTNLKD